MLRDGHPRESARFDGDDHPDAHHFAAIDKTDVIGCVTLLPSEYKGEPAWQLRGMAVAPDARGRGVGAALLRHVADHLPPPPMLWCKAREPAVPFYEKHGWTPVSGPFTIPHAGPHRRMIFTR